MKSSNRNFGLDIIRATAVMSVMVYHWIVVSPFNARALSNKVVVFGFYGVELFFVLSGFLIGNIIIRTFSRGGYSLAEAKDFWVRRWLRTLPMYYFIFCVCLIKASDRVIAEVRPVLWKFVFFLQNISKWEYRTFLGFGWSLTIEEWFYLLFPLVLLVLSKVIMRWVSKKYILLFCVLLFIISGIAVRSYIIHKSGGWIEDGSNLRQVVIARVDAIAYGVLGAWFFSFYPALFKKYRYMFGIVGAIALAFSVVYFYTQIVAKNHSLFRQISLFEAVYFISWVGLSILFLLPLFYYIEIRTSIVVKSVTYFSEISYSLYLIHPFMLAIPSTYFPGEGVFDYCIRFYVFLGLSVLFSSITYKYIEQPFLKLRNKIAKRELSLV